MDSTEKTSTNTKPALYLGAFLISVVGGILFFFAEFSWWQGAYSWGYDFALYGEFVPWYGKVILVILGLAYLFVAFVSLYKLYPFIKLPEDVVNLLELIAIVAALAVVGLTVIVAIIFAIMVSDATDWDFGTTFYTGLLGGIVATALLWFARKTEPAK
ncbi:MAG: hypothetical protein KGD64_03665 [Candidatus Heimdallarchaeota archaeon]|nr:hypothetical protein [Candidatus Heimdallarchaeota archaeon]